MSVDTVLDRPGNIRDSSEVKIPVNSTPDFLSYAPESVRDDIRNYFSQINLRRYFTTHDFMEYERAFAHLSILYPDRFDLFNFSPSDNYYGVLDKSVNKFFKEDPDDSRLADIIEMAGPDRYLYLGKVEFPSEEDLVRKINAHSKVPPGAKNWEPIALSLLGDFGDILGKDIGQYLSPEFREAIVEYYISKDDLIFDLEDLRRIKLLMPELIPQIIPDLNLFLEDDKVKFYDREYSKRSIYNDAHVTLGNAASLQVLSAETASFTPYGIKLTFPSPAATQKVITVAETRRFDV